MGNSDSSKESEPKELPKAVNKEPDVSSSAICSQTDEEVTTKFGDLNLQDKKDINILLLGETGVGKSTFINSMVNYLHFTDFEDAINHPLLHIIPCMFNITDENSQIHKVVIGSDSNEYQLIGDSATQDVRTYVFPIGNGKTRLRLIDTPGMGDPRGADQDDINCENILSHIGQLHELHAICFLFKPNEARITVTFEYCMKQILSRLEKSAAKNIIFIFTNAKGTNYKPGETFTCLRKMVDDINKKPPFVEIKVQDNVFCFDNEAFRYLGALKEGLNFEEDTKNEYSKSWNNSSQVAWKLIKYIIGDIGHDPLAPHIVRSSLAINEARRVIYQLSQPLADISQLILDNLKVLDRRLKELNHDNLSLAELKSKLYVPVINMKVIKLTQPTTVCCDAKCTELSLIEGVNTMNYKQRCHDPCHLKNVPKEIIGAPQLSSCAAMNPATQTCLKCGCPQNVHMHIYYMTKKFDDKKMDDNVMKRINTMEAGLTEAGKIIREITKRKNEMEEEKDIIINIAAKFAHFLQENAISPFNDAYKKYIEYMIFREESLGKETDFNNLRHLQDLLQKYKQIQSTFDQAVLSAKGDKKKSPALIAKDIPQELQKLYELKHNGKTIKELYQSQKTSRKKEAEKTEYIHAFPARPITKNKQETKTKNDTNVSRIIQRSYRNISHGKLSNTGFSEHVNVKIIRSVKPDVQDNLKIPELPGKSGRKNRNRKGNRSDGDDKMNQFKGREFIRWNNTGSQQWKDGDKKIMNQSKVQDSIRKDEKDSQQSNTVGKEDNSSPRQDNPPLPPGNRSGPDDRTLYDNRPPYNYRGPYEYRPPYYYGLPPLDNRPPHDYRPPHYDNRAPYDYWSPHYDNRAPRDYRPSHYDYRPPHYDNRAPYDYMPPYDSRPPLGSRPPHDDRPPHDYYENHPPRRSVEDPRSTREYPPPYK